MAEPKRITREVFVANVDELAKMSDAERDEVFARMAYDATVAANKIREAKGQPLFELIPIEEMIRLNSGLDSDPG